MVDINLIRQDPDKFRRAVKAKQKDSSVIDSVLKQDEKRRDLLSQVEQLRAKRNEVSKQGKESIEEGKKIKEELKKVEPQLAEVEEKYNQAILQVPNLFSDDTPIGKDESENKVIRAWGEPTKFDFEPKDHVELGQTLGVIETEKAAKVSGARFAYLMGDLARLEFALVQFAFETLTNSEVIEKIAKSVAEDLSAKVFIPVVPPVMMRPDVMQKMARLEPKEERYYIPQSDQYLVGSAEHTLGPLHMDETLNEKDLPIRYVGFSTSFREEAGSYGKDMKGIFRLHQFDKVEMESFCLPENSIKEQDFFVAIQEYMMQQLGIPYQVVQICTGDMGSPDFRQIDIESWMPGQNKYRETHTSDLMTDYQSRRLNTKVKRNTGENEYIHMNDATFCSTNRPLIAIMENFQTKDGSVIIPEVLRKWMGKEKIVKN